MKRTVVRPGLWWLVVITGVCCASSAEKGALRGICRRQTLPGPAGAKAPPPTPLAGMKILVFDDSSIDPVARTQSGPDGKFSLELKPGRYRVLGVWDKAEGDSGFKEVEVVPGKTAEAELTWKLNLPAPP